MRNLIFGKEDPLVRMRILIFRNVDPLSRVRIRDLRKRRSLYDNGDPLLGISSKK